MAEREPLTPAAKRELLAELVTRHGLTIGVETGLYNGGGSLMHLHPSPLERLYLLDLQPANIEIARMAQPSAVTVCGDTRYTLPTVCELIEAPAIFWLDAHLVDWVDRPEAVEAFPCPLLDELDAITNSAICRELAHVVAIDDLRLMDGQGSWPTLPELHAAIDEHRIWQWREQGDVMVLDQRGSRAAAS